MTFRGVISLGITALLAAASPAYAQDELALRLYLDFTGGRPSSNQLAPFRAMEDATAADRRTFVQETLKTQLMTHPNFEMRLRNYFSGLFGLSEQQGLVAPACAPGVTNDPTCITPELARDFRDEPATYIAAVMSGRAESNDVRSILTSRYTVMTPRMATFLRGNPTVRMRIGLDNISVSSLDDVMTQPADTWNAINRDPGSVGLATGTPGHREQHSGVMTTPAYLLRSPTHLSRAYNHLQWFMCRSLAQAPVVEGRETKLFERAPCSGCHSYLEPAGSHFVHWRAKLDTTSATQPWVLDGVARKDAQGRPLINDGVIPADASDPMSVHSRTLDGTFRGKSGKGVQTLARNSVDDPDFGRCVAKHAWQFLLGRPMDASESGWADVLGRRLSTDYNWDVREVFVDIVLSRAYAPGSR